MKKPTGIIRMNIDNEDFSIEFNGSLNAFKQFTGLIVDLVLQSSFKLKEAMYFDEGLTDEELKKLKTNINGKA